MISHDKLQEIPHRLVRNDFRDVKVLGLCIRGGGLQHGGSAADLFQLSSLAIRLHSGLCHLQKLSGEQESRGVIAEENHLLLNTRKTKEVVIGHPHTGEETEQAGGRRMLVRLTSIRGVTPPTSLHHCGGPGQLLPP